MEKGSQTAGSSLSSDDDDSCGLVGQMLGLPIKYDSYYAPPLCWVVLGSRFTGRGRVGLGDGESV